MTTLLLAGATGLVGRHALSRSLADERVTRVVAPTRRPLAPHPKLLNPIIDSTDLQPEADWWRVDGAICALGTTRAKAGSAAAFRAIDFDYTLAVATQIRRHGATRFALTSSMGADAGSRFFYPRVKGELEDAVRALGFDALTIVRPGMLGGERADAEMLERITGVVLRTLAPILPAVAKISPAPTVAAFLLDAATAGVPGEHIRTSREIALAAAEAT